MAEVDFLSGAALLPQCAALDVFAQIAKPSGQAFIYRPAFI